MTNGNPAGLAYENEIQPWFNPPEDYSVPTNSGVEQPLKMSDKEKKLLNALPDEEQDSYFMSGGKKIRMIKLNPPASKTKN